MSRATKSTLLLITLLTITPWSARQPALGAEEGVGEGVLLRYEFQGGRVFEYVRSFSRSRHARLDADTTVQVDESGQWDLTILPVATDGGECVLLNKASRGLGLDRCVKTIQGRPQDLTAALRMQWNRKYRRYPQSDAGCAQAGDAGGVFQGDIWNDGPMAAIAPVMDIFALPENKVAPGDSWKRSRSFGLKKVNYEYTYLGTEKKGDVECHLISGTFDMVGPHGRPVGGKEIKAEATLWISVEGTHPVAAEAKIVMGDGGDGTATERLSLELTATHKIAEEEAPGYYAPVALNAAMTLALQEDDIEEARALLDELRERHSEYRFARHAEDTFHWRAYSLFKSWRDAVFSGDYEKYYREKRRKLLGGSLACIDDQRVNLEACNALMLLSRFEGIPVPPEGMATLLSEKNERLRAAAAMLIGQDPAAGEEHLAATIMATLDGAPAVRRIAAAALASFADIRAAEALLPLLDDKTASVRKAALGGLQRLTGRKFGADKEKWTAWLKTAGKLSPAPLTRATRSELERLAGEYMTAEPDRAEAVLAEIKKTEDLTFGKVMQALKAKPQYRQMPVGFLDDLAVQGEGASRGAAYALYVPEDYDPAEPLPMMVVLAGDVGTGNAALAATWARDGLGDFIILAPSSGGTAEGMWWNNGKYNVVAAVRETMSRYNVDTDRVFISGHSNGGIGAWHIAVRFPDLFAGLAPNAGYAAGEGMQSIDDAALENLINVPTLVQHGALDHTIPLSYPRDNVQKMKEFGCDVEMKVYPGLSHSFMKTKEGNIAQFVRAAEFARAHRRDPFPRRLVFLPPAEGCTSAYWLDTVRDGDSPSVRAEIKEDNVIEIETEDIKRVTVRLSDAMVDMARPITIRLNGVEVFSGKVERSTDTLLRSARDTQDVSRAWSAEMTFQVE